MSNLVFNHGGHLVTDSLTVAEVFGKLHKNVIQSIDNLTCSDEFRQLNFQLSDYTGVGEGINKNKKYNKYLIKKDGLVFLIMGYTGAEASKFKEQYINEFNRMENELRQKPTSSYQIDDPIERAKQWIVEQEQLKLAQAELEAAKPKVESFDTFMNTDKLYTVRETAKLLGLPFGDVKLFGLLREKGVLQDNRNYRNQPYQQFLNRGYFQMKQATKNGKSYVVTLVTPKGVVWIEKGLRQLGIVTNPDSEIGGAID